MIKNYGTILYLIGLVAIFYFMIIRPQQQRAKQQKETLNSLAPGVKVTTYSGIMGSIVKVKDETIILKIADNVNVEMLKASVASTSKEDSE